jgi:hypothetical protein
MEREEPKIDKGFHRGYSFLNFADERLEIVCMRNCVALARISALHYGGYTA